MFGVAPTARAAKVLRDDAGMRADTLAKLLHEWRDGRPRRAPTGSLRAPPSSSTRRGWSGPERSTSSSRSPHRSGGDWCSSATTASSTPSAAAACSTRCAVTAASTSSRRSIASGTAGNKPRALQLRAGNPAAIDTYLRPRTDQRGSFAVLAATAARAVVAHHDAERTAADRRRDEHHVDALNLAIQRGGARQDTLDGSPSPSLAARRRPLATSS